VDTRVVELCEIYTTLSAEYIATLFQDKITKPQSRGLRLVAGKFNWSFYEPDAAEGHFARIAPRAGAPAHAIGAHALRPERGGVVRQAADAMATGNFLLGIWDGGSSREARLIAPAAPAWKSYTGHFLSSITVMDATARITRGEQRVPAN
jgi:hypothetical protein